MDRASVTADHGGYLIRRIVVGKAARSDKKYIAELVEWVDSNGKYILQHRNFLERPAALRYFGHGLIVYYGPRE